MDSLIYWHRKEPDVLHSKSHEARVSLTVVETIVENILSKRSELSQEQILALIEEKKREGRGLLSDEGAARLVAEELLIQTRGSDLARMQVKDLVPGLNDVTISGIVLLAWPPQDFQRKDGTPGRVMRIVLADRSQRVRCAIWDRHVDVLSRADPLQGRILRVGHAYTRQGLGGDTEVHAGDRSSIQVDPEDLPKSDLPAFGDLFSPLGKLSIGASQVNVIGVIQTEPRRYTFSKEERAGSVLRAMLADESGTIPLVAWNERADDLLELRMGDIVQALNGRVRQDRNGSPELHVESRSQVQVLKSPPPYLKPPVAKVSKLAELTPRGLVDLTVRILSVGASQEIKRPTGETVKVARLLVADETGMVTLSLWDDKASLAQELRKEDVIEIEGASVRERQGANMLSLGRAGKLQKNTSKNVVAKGSTKINALQQAKGLVTVEGSIADAPLARQVVLQGGEKIDLASFTVRDDTSACRVTFWRDQASTALKLRTGVRVRLRGMRVRTGLNGEFELSSIPLSSIETLGEEVKDRPAWEDIRHVIALEPGLRTWVKGVILEVLDVPKIAFLCESCGSQLVSTENQLLCPNCSLPRQGNPVITAHIRLDDGTGVLDVRLSNVNADKVPNLDYNDIRARAVNGKSAEIQLNGEQGAKLVGKEVELNGVAKHSDHGKMEFLVEKMLYASKN